MTKKKTNKQIVGQKGERRAAAFLVARRYQILEQNLRIAGGEIDILAEDEDGTLVVVEVKTRSSSEFLNPQVNVDFKKIRTLKRLALAIASRNPAKNVRVDVIEVADEINHIQNILV